MWSDGQLLPKNQEVFNELTDTLKVLARADPEDKLLLVCGLKAKGEKVAMLGKSRSDEPAMDEAFVSFSLQGCSSLSHKSSLLIKSPA